MIKKELNAKVAKVVTTIYTALLAAILAGSCATPSPPSLVPSGNPPGYAVHTLSAESLASRRVAINGLSVDTSSVEAIAASVAAIVASRNAPAIVEELADRVGGQAANLSIDFTAPTAPVPPRFYGMNLHIRSLPFIIMPIYRELVRHIRLDILRFPGGQDRILYDRSGISTVRTSSPDGVYQFRLTGEAVANVIGFCRELGIEAEPELNLYNDDPAMAADLIDQIVNELGYDLRYVSAGNEPEMNALSNWTYLEATDGPTAIRHYTERFVRARAAIADVRPGLVYVLAETASIGAPALASELDAIYGGLNGIQTGALSTHWYLLGEWPENNAFNSQYPSIARLAMFGNRTTNISYLAALHRTLRESADRYDPGAELVIGEWGPAWSAGEASTAVQDRLCTAIFNAEVQEYCKVLGFDILEWYSLSDPSSFNLWAPALISVHNTTVEVRPQYYVYLMYEYLYGNRIVAVPGGRTSQWSIYASSDTVRNYLMLINRSETRTFVKTIEVVTAEGPRRLRLTLYPHSVSIVSFQ